MGDVPNMRVHLQEASIMTSLSRRDPTLLRRPVYGMFKTPAEVADFTEGKRPAVRVACHCRNCHWKGEARVPVGEKIPLWLRCPRCEMLELSAHGDFLGRDDQSHEQDVEHYLEYQKELDAMHARRERDR
jgi:hypothetical protein